MPYDDGRITACISSQAGCGMGCKFCATGQMGFSRQLSSTEIFEQVVQFNNVLAKQQQNDVNKLNNRVTNVVFMGNDYLLFIIYYLLFVKYVIMYNNRVNMQEWVNHLLIIIM